MTCVYLYNEHRYTFITTYINTQPQRAYMSLLTHYNYSFVKWSLQMHYICDIVTVYQTSTTFYIPTIQLESYQEYVVHFSSYTEIYLQFQESESLDND